MANLGEEFRADDVPEDDRSFEPLPAGDYVMQVIESAVVPTKSGSGDQLVLTLEVIDGPFNNRRMWDRLNIRNQNADAQRIAQRSLADLCLAVGVTALTDSEQLHFKPFVGRVTIKPDKSGQYGPQNAVRYKPRGGKPPAQKAVPTSAPSAGAQQTGTIPASATGHPSAAAASRSSPRPWVGRT